MEFLEAQHLNVEKIAKSVSRVPVQRVTLILKIVARKGEKIVRSSPRGEI